MQDGDSTQCSFTSFDEIKVIDPKFINPLKLSEVGATDSISLRDSENPNNI